ncbi:MAG: hypothetical protein JWQ85_876, partial [Mucilaginibacter sp.]|nr:hypothetical protein [Mucilaginibacter sp.]
MATWLSYQHYPTRFYWQIVFQVDNIIVYPCRE